MYWSSEHETFLPAPDNQESLAQDNDKKEDKKDKVKTAKRIAKDMEKWAKTLNQRKEAAKSNQVPANPQCQSGGLTKINIGSSRNAIPDKAGVEDIAFSMLNKRDFILIFKKPFHFILKSYVWILFIYFTRYKGVLIEGSCSYLP